MPGNCSTVPDMPWMQYLVLSVVKHVGGRDLEVVLGKIETEQPLVMIREPQFLEEDYLGLFLCYQGGKIVLVTSVSFQVEQEDIQ